MQSLTKFYKSLALYFCLIFTSLSIYAATTSVILVLDAANKPGLPRNFRTTSDTLPASPSVSTQGLAQLHIMGSAQFSALGLQAVIQKINQPIIIVDLRQESHGYINGNAISWFGLHDWGNLNKSNTQVDADQQQRLTDLAKQTTVTVNKIIGKNTSGMPNTTPITLTVSQVLSEAQLAKQYHLGYQRFYVTDGWRPSDQEVDRFVQFARNITTNTWLYIHCRGGKGRTTTFMSMVDMMHNAKQVSFADILQRQNLLGGIKLAKLPQQQSYKYNLASQRLAFLQRFYQYCVANTDNYQTGWIAWNKQKSLH